MHNSKNKRRIWKMGTINISKAIYLYIGRLKNESETRKQRRSQPVKNISI